MSNRIAAALERIADALEAQVASDPMAMFASVLDDPVASEVKSAIAGNGVTQLYAHPDKDWHIVARKDGSEPGGYTVTVEPA